MTHIVVLSGGIDSTAALAVTVEAGQHEVLAVTFDYNQRHEREIHSAIDVVRHYDVGHHLAELPLLHGSALLSEVPVPDGHYSDKTMALTVVQGRNLLFAAAAIAQTDPGDTVVFGVHSGDHAIYPDCRPPFWNHLDIVADAYEVTVATPFIDMTKAEVVRAGDTVGAPFALTWSCYKGGEVHCGRCGTCVERAEAFDLAGVADPTTYADPAYWRSVV